MQCALEFTLKHVTMMIRGVNTALCSAKPQYLQTTFPCLFHLQQHQKCHRKREKSNNNLKSILEDWKRNLPAQKELLLKKQESWMNTLLL